MTNLPETFDSHPEKYGSDAFRLEYSSDTHPQTIKKDLESFLGEYVFELGEYNYGLLYEDGKILDPNTRETMTGKSDKVIRIRKSEEKITTREEAELEGFSRLEKKLLNASEGQTIVWLSPPGAKKEGYGDWGFVYLGEVSNDSRLLMTAIRVEQPSIKDYQNFFDKLSNVTFVPFFEENFLANPLVIADKNIQQVHSLIPEFFRQQKEKRDDLSPSFVNTMQELTPYIEKYLKIVQTGGSKAFEQQIFNMILNYSLDLKTYFEEGGKNSVSLPFYRIFEQYAYRVPPLVGSCGSIGSSNDIFNSFNPISRILNPDTKAHWDYHDGNCVVCNKKSTEVGPCSICKQCEKKFD